MSSTNIFLDQDWKQVVHEWIESLEEIIEDKGESFQPRLLIPMSLGFDHRIINGADAARFLQELKRQMEDYFLWNF